MENQNRRELRALTLGEIINQKQQERNLIKNCSKMGRIERRNDEITVYVSLEYVDSFERSNTLMSCDSIRIHYIFDQILFPRFIRFYVYDNVSVSFKNCIFQKGIAIHNGGECATLENNINYEYLILDSIGLRGDFILKGNKLLGSFDSVGDDKLIFRVFCGTLKLENFNVRVAEANIVTLNFIMEQSKLLATGDIFICSPRIQMKDGELESTSGIEIENSGDDFNGKAIAPVVIYNDKELSETEEERERVRLRDARERLVQTLHTIWERYDAENQQELLSYAKKLNSRVIGKSK